MIQRRTLLKSPLAMAAHVSPVQQGTYRLVRDIPVEEGYDLVVAGGGPSGAAAAICAAREGARVLLAEATGCMGGMATSGMVMSFAPMGDGSRCLAGGLIREVVDTLYKQGFLKPGLHPDVWSKIQGWVPFNAEGLKLLYDDLATAAGVEVRLFTQVIDADADPRRGQVNGVVIHDIEGYHYIRSRAFVDGTGNAELAALCGAPCREAGRDTPNIMPPTLISLFSGIDWRNFGKGSEALKKALADGFFKTPDPHLSGLGQVGQSIGFANAGHIFNLNALRVKSMTDGMMYGRKLAQEYVAYYRKYLRGCENLELACTAPLMGVRESRRIVGEYELDVVDFEARRHFPDQIALNNWPIDIHPYEPSKQAMARFEREFLGRRYKPGEYYGIPYGVLVPKGWKNLWVPGRCISVDIPVQSSARTGPVCSMLGQAAGTAAIQSIRTRRPAAEIDTEVLVATLRKAGAYLPQQATAKRMTHKN
ncbi:MAG: FAD-dependent oxidoreductase [Acidobacteriales bacterium]|nr:FAD-dependent oxidoreductase [Terriglobales bacterium]